MAESGNQMSQNQMIEIICCILLPPVAIFVHDEMQFSGSVCLNIVLCLLFWIPVSLWLISEISVSV